MYPLDKANQLIEFYGDGGFLFAFGSEAALLFTSARVGWDEAQRNPGMDGGWIIWVSAIASTYLTTALLAKGARGR